MSETSPPNRKRAPTKRRSGPHARAAGTVGKRKPSRQTKKRPRFEPASAEDFAAVEAALDKALKKAESSDPLTAEQRIERDFTIVAGAAMGLRPATIAERVGLGEAHVRRILKAHRERRAHEPPPDGFQLLEDALEALDFNIEQATLLAADNSAEMKTQRLGALRTKHEMQIARLELLQAMGRVGARPTDHLREREIVELVVRMLGYLRDHKVEEEIIDGISREVLPARVRVLPQRGAA